MFDAPIKTRNELFEEAPPSGKIRHALADIRQMERDPKMSIDMGFWINPPPLHEKEKPCRVCFAGAVMVNSYEINPYEGHSLSSFSSDKQADFLFLDMARMGLVDISTFGVALADQIQNDFDHRIGEGRFKEYDECRSTWFEQMEILADVMEEYGR